MNATASSQTGCSDLASAPEQCPCGARAAATSPPAFVNKPHPFSQLLPDLLLLNLTHTTLDSLDKLQPKNGNAQEPDREKLAPCLHLESDEYVVLAV